MVGFQACITGHMTKGSASGRGSASGGGLHPVGLHRGVFIHGGGGVCVHMAAIFVQLKIYFIQGNHFLKYEIGLTFTRTYIFNI